ncbi:MAG: periplasmic heavy metal sensor [Alphaproteobacteria bacterium]|nr:periplasmic heavy metal sensor [Alphaproteobacteria bacterium]
MERKQWINIALFASLGFNLFALGFMLGKPPQPPMDRKPHFERILQQVKQLPEDQRAKVKEIIKFYKPLVREGFDDMRAAREDLDSLMRSEDYTREESEMLFATLSESAEYAYENAQMMMMDIADALPPESRALVMPPPRGEEPAK